MRHRLSTYVAATKIPKPGHCRCTRREILAVMRRAGRITGIGAVVLLLSLTARAVCAAERTIIFDISRQNAGDALPAFGEQADISVIYQYDQVKDHETNRLKGEYTIPEAAAILLDDTGLTARFENGRHLIVTKINDREKRAMMAKKSVLATVIGVLFGPGGAQGAAAQAESGTGAKLEEVVVTAQKREQSLQDVSAAVTAFSGDQLRQSQINNIEDIQVMLPGLTFGNDFNFAKIFVRGVGMSSSFAGIDPSVALHVDGAVIAQAAAQFTSLYDLERMEVLRGPQGTLYGRNATGGSINLITAKPTEELEGYSRLTVGGGDLNIIAEGAVSGPLAESVLGRLAVWHQKRDGYGEHTGSGEDIDNADKLGVRAQLHFLISDRVDNLLAAEHYRENENSRAVKFIRASFPDTTNPSLQAIGLPDVRPGSRDAGGDFLPIAELDTSSVTNTLTWQASDAVTLKSISNYRDFSNLLLQDFDVSDTVNGSFPPSLTSTTQLQTIDTEQFSEELQFLYDGDRWRGIVGLYYFSEDVDSGVHIGRDPLNRQDLSRVAVEAQLDVEAYALFTNFTYALNDAWNLKAGARYSHEERRVDNLFGVAPPTASAAIFDPEKTDSKSFDDVSPEIGIEYRTTNDILLYTTYSEGFKSGTANLGERSPTVINPETIENLEMGMKGAFLDNTLQLNLAGFVYEVADAQFDRTFPIPAPPFFSARLENAAVTDGKGVELEARWAASDRLTLDFNATLYDIEFDEFDSLDPLNEDLFGADSTSVQPESLAGNVPRNTPEWSYNLHAAYDIPLTSGAFLTLGGNLATKGKQYYTEFNNPAMGADSYSIVDAKMLYTSADGKLTVNFWGKNLTDEKVLSGAYAISTSRTITGTYLPPRQYGVTVGYNF